jgi:hypothetical protein
MSDESSDRDPFEVVAESFLAQLARLRDPGRKPDVANGPGRPRPPGRLARERLQSAGSPRRS